MTTTPSTTTNPAQLASGSLDQIVREGYGPGAWHGPDLAAAVADVTADMALRRPAAGRHNIAEIALHHAWCVRSVIAQLAQRPAEAFPIPGEDWFAIDPDQGVSWEVVRELLDDYQTRLARVVAELGSNPQHPLSESERLGLVLGITCHAVYHAGQIQLIKLLVAA